MKRQELCLTALLLLGTLWTPACGGNEKDDPGDPPAPPPTFTVTYEANGSTGGSAPVDVNRYLAGDTVTVLGPGDLVRTGHTFNGWNTTADGSGTARMAGTTFAIDGENVWLHAQWTADPTYTVTYDANGAEGGDVPVDANRYTASQIVTVLGNSGNLVRTGFAFAGWYTAEAPATTLVADDTFPMPAANVTLLARWEIAYSITYLANGANGTPPSTEYFQAGSPVTLAWGWELSWLGHLMTRWNTASDGSGTAYDRGAEITMPANDLVLYAQWVIQTYQVVYFGNGHTSGNPPSMLNDVSYGTQITIADPSTMLSTGHKFDEWNTETDGSGSGTGYKGNTYRVRAARRF